MARIEKSATKRVMSMNEYMRSVPLSAEKEMDGVTNVMVERVG